MKSYELFDGSRGIKYLAVFIYYQNETVQRLEDGIALSETRVNILYLS